MQIKCFETLRDLVKYVNTYASGNVCCLLNGGLLMMGLLKISE